VRSISLDSGKVWLVISVCVATHNGARWIEAQLRSVLSQIGGGDEVIVVDDASSDRTVATILALADPRIRIVQNERNVGVDLTFQRALTLAKGDVLFLCDQDDLWHPHKVKRVMRVFQVYPDVTLVLSDAQLIDASGQLLAPSYFAIRGAYRQGVLASIVKSKFLGCAMAVRSSMRKYFLPFPIPIPGHDMWIGTINELYGKTCFLPEPLISYRRHGSNASPDRHQGVARMLSWRWQLVRGVAQRLLTIRDTQ
jgi:glycosyltransferase involved in cell wall biosynthesis